jgi:acetyl esterase/lipase
MIADTAAAFITAAQAQGTSLQVIDVADGQHGFGTLDHTDESRRAVCQALSWVSSAFRPQIRRLAKRTHGSTGAVSQVALGPR